MTIPIIDTATEEMLLNTLCNGREVLFTNEPGHLYHHVGGVFIIESPLGGYSLDKENIAKNLSDSLEGYDLVIIRRRPHVKFLQVRPPKKGEIDLMTDQPFRPEATVYDYSPESADKINAIFITMRFAAFKKDGTRGEFKQKTMLKELR